MSSDTESTDFRVSKFIQSTFDFLGEDENQNKSGFCENCKHREHGEDEAEHFEGNCNHIEQTHHQEGVEKTLSCNRIGLEEREEDHDENKIKILEDTILSYDEGEVPVIQQSASSSESKTQMPGFRASAFINDTFGFLEEQDKTDNPEITPNVEVTCSACSEPVCSDIKQLSNHDRRNKEVTEHIHSTCAAETDDVGKNSYGENNPLKEESCTCCEDSMPRSGSYSPEKKSSCKEKNKKANKKNPHNNLLTISEEVRDHSDSKFIHCDRYQKRTSGKSEDSDVKPNVLTTKEECVDPVVMRQREKTTGPQPQSTSSVADGDESDDDDDDAGIYAESYRNSKWIYVGNNKELEQMLQAAAKDNVCQNEMSNSPRENLHVDAKETEPTKAKEFMSPHDHDDHDRGHPDLVETNAVTTQRGHDSGIQVLASDGESEGRSADASPEASPPSTIAKADNAVIESITSMPPIPPPQPPAGAHRRSDSISTTVSEKEFQRRYHTVTTRVVQRKSSVQRYNRLSERFVDCEREILLRKAPGRDFGFHIRGNGPAEISMVEKGSIAEENGVKEGDFIIAVNDVNVLHATHDEIIDLIKQDPVMVVLEVTDNADFLKPNADQPLCEGYLYKQGGSLIKTWRRRWFVLKQDHCLYYYKQEGEKDPLGAIMLTNYTVTKAPEINKQHAFKATKYGSRTYFFHAECEADMNRWAGHMAVAAQTSQQTDAWIDISSHNVGLAALAIQNPDCFGHLTKMGNRKKTWKRRYCVLKDACLYYYMDRNSSTAKGLTIGGATMPATITAGIAHLHGYTVQEVSQTNKKFGFQLNPPEAKMRTFHFIAENEKEKLRWTEAMKQSIGRWVQAE